jgi:hypothetical protein
MHLGRAAAATLSLVTLGCRGDGGDEPAPPPSAVTTAPSVATTVARIPALTGDPIPSLEPAGLHANLGRIGFTTAAPATAPGFVTTTSRREDATVSTYGKGPTDVVKIIAEANTAAAPTVLVSVAAAPLRGSEARRAETWVKAELRKGAIGPTQPRMAKATYGRQPYELLVTSTTATLSIGRLTTGS